ncbi:MAG: hypothetical protein WD342_14835 [Verrucomicrobiales bacterium]
MKIPPFVLVVICAGLSALHAPAQELTPEVVESLKARLQDLKDNLDSHLSKRNIGAGQRFMEAASDPRTAVEEYLQSYKTVHFDRQNLPESDFRAWKSGQSNRLSDDQFVESLQHQLRYLALSCRAAQAEDIDEIFNPLMSYLDGLSRLENPPAASLTQSVAGSVFSAAYYLERLLKDNPNWEPVPFNIGGIYEKTIMPYLREENPEALMGAWDKRIEQETRLVTMLEETQESELRGMDRDQKRKTKLAQNRVGGVVGRLDQEEFVARTLPKLRWAKLKDMFHYVDQTAGAQAMLAFVEEHLTHEYGEEFFEEFLQVIESSRVSEPASPQEPAPDSN